MTRVVFRYWCVFGARRLFALPELFPESQRMLTGSQIREARKRAGMSQGALATAVGVSLRTIGGWERDENSPNLAEPRLLEVLGPYVAEDAGGGRREAPVEKLTDMELLAELGRRLGQRAVSEDEWKRIRNEELAAEHGHGSIEARRYSLDSPNPHPLNSIAGRAFEESRQHAREVFEALTALYDGSIKTNDPRAAKLPADPPTTATFTESGGAVQFDWAPVTGDLLAFGLRDDGLGDLDYGHGGADAPEIPEGLAADDPGEPTQFDRQHEAEHGDDNTGR